MTNPYCTALRIDQPVLETLAYHPEANVYSLLVASILESGRPMTLIEVARRFEVAGIAPVERALLSLQRCKPARAPVYREGDRYAIDTHDDGIEWWLFRMGLRPPKAPSRPPAEPRAAPAPLPGQWQRLSVAELDEAWRGADVDGWSGQRLAVAVLDAHDGPMSPEAVVAFVGARARTHRFSVAAEANWNRASAVRCAADGRWELDPGHAAVISARDAVRNRIASVRSDAAQRPDPAEVEASRRRAEEREAAHAAELAALRRVLVHTFPARAPVAAVLIDVGEHWIETFLADRLVMARDHIESYDVVGAVNVRAVLASLGVAAEDRRVHELGPPQKTRRLNRSGRTLKITTDMLIRGSCGISRPFGDEEKLRDYLREGRMERFRQRLEADAKSLLAMYQYGRLHGYLRLRWGFLDDTIHVPWVHVDEEHLYGLVRRAASEGKAIEVVTGSAPGWADPWARARRCAVQRSPGGFGYELFDESGFLIDDREVQLARAVPRGGSA